MLTIVDFEFKRNYLQICKILTLEQNLIQLTGVILKKKGFEFVKRRNISNLSATNSLFTIYCL